MKKPSIKKGSGVISKTAKKTAASNKPKFARASTKKTGAGKFKRNPVKKLARYGVRVENARGQVGYFSGWNNKTGPQFDTDIGEAVKGGDRKLMAHFADAIAERKPRGIVSVEVVIIGAPVKKN